MCLGREHEVEPDAEDVLAVAFIQDFAITDRATPNYDAMPIGRHLAADVGASFHSSPLKTAGER